MKRNCRIAAFVLLILCLVLFVCSACGEDPEQVISDSSAEQGSDALHFILKSENKISGASFSTRKEGTISTSVGIFPLDLRLHSSRIREGAALFTEDVIDGVLSGASVRTFEQGNAHLILQGTASGETTVWNESPIALTADSFQASMGQCFGGLSAYLLNEQTIRSAALISEENGVLTYDVELDPFLSTEEYSKRLRTMLGTDGAPRFTRIRMIVTAREDAFPISVFAEEEYAIDLPVFGETKFVASYEEYFSYETQVIPSGQLFTSHLKDHAQGGVFQMPGALSMVNALLGNDQTMDLTIATPDSDIKGMLSINPSMKTLWLYTDGVNLLYSDGKYFIKTIENKLFAEKEVFEKAVSPVALRFAQASLTPWIELLTGLKPSMRDASLVYEAEVGNTSLKMTFSADVSSLISLEFSDDRTAIDLRRSSATLELPTLIGYTDISDSLTALSFFDTGDAAMQYELTIEGLISVEGLAKLSFQDGFALEFRGDELSASLIDGHVTANLNGVSFSGTAEEAEALVSVWTNPKEKASKQTGLLSDLSVDAFEGVLTASVDGKTFTLSSDKLIVETSSVLCTIVKKGISEEPVVQVDPVGEPVSFEALLAFSNASIYPSLLGGGSAKAAVRLELNGKLFNGELILLPQKPFTAGLTLSNGDETIGVVFMDETIYYSDSRIDAYIDTIHLSEFQKLLSSFSENEKKECRILACDSEELSLVCGDLTVRVTDEGILAVSDDLTLSVFHFTSSPERVLISKPNKLLCTDLFILANLMNGIREQSEFTFVGAWETKQFTSSVDRLSLILGADGFVSSMGMEWSAAGKMPKKLYMTDEGIFLDEGNGKYFCSREALKPIVGETPLDFASVWKQIRRIALQNQALILSADTFDATLKFEDGKLASVLYSTPEETYRLEEAYLPPISLPARDEYRDISALGNLFDVIHAAKDSGGFTVSGTLSLSVSILDGKAPFSGVFDVQDGLTGYLSFEVPYVQGVTTKDIPSSDGLRILASCKIKSEAFILDDCVYIRKVMTATYGVVFSKTVTLTKTGYFTLDEFRSNPMKAFVFLLNIENGLVNAVPAAQPWNTLYGIEWTGDRYSFDLAPELLSTAAKSLNLKMEVERDHLSMISLTSDIAPAKLRIDMKLANYGQADPSRYLPKDFSTFPHL